MSDTYQSETPQRQRYIKQQLKQIMKDNDIKSFKSLKEYLENPQTPEETDWSVYINGSSKKDLSMMDKAVSKRLSNTEKIKEKILNKGNFKQISEEKYILTDKKYGYHQDKKISATIEKVLYRGEFKLIARDKKGRYASFVKK